MRSLREILLKALRRLVALAAGLLIAFQAYAQRRPQDPVPPLPYSSTDVQFRGAKTGNLYGTLTKPNDAGGRLPAVLLLSASGSHDRDQTAFGHRTLLVLADRVTRLGFIVLRIDFRGYGKSPGTPTSTTEAFSFDAEAAFEMLKSRDDVNINAIGLLGHSEGGLIATLLMERRNDIAFSVMLNMALLNIGEVIVAQAYTVPKAMGKPETFAERNALTARRWIEIARKNQDSEIRKQLLTEAIETARVEAGESREWARGQLEFMNSDWMQFALHYEPTRVIGITRVPTLLLFGGSDIQVGPEAQLEKLRETRSTTAAVETRVVPNVNHLLQPSSTGDPREYARIPTTVADAMWDEISRWLVVKRQEVVP